MPVQSTHCEYDEREPQWERCRDAYEGEDEVKEEGVKYLPMLGGQKLEEYQAYKTRAMWYGATDRTIKGLTGGVMRVEPKVTGPEQLLTQLDDVTLTGQNLDAFAKCLVSEVLTTGRAGLFLDMTDHPTPGTTARPYWCWYCAEQIVNWQTETRNGVPTLTLVVLKEEQAKATDDAFVVQEQCQYRVLKLTSDGVYVVELWVEAEKKTLESKTEYELKLTLTPKIKGVPLNYIPFVFVNALTLEPYPDKPPLLDLVNVNYSHYRSSADLEHGRHFTALPTPYITGMGGTSALKIGSATAWLIPQAEARVGMLEFSGAGLGALALALETKERLMAVLGARMLEEQKAAAEAADTIKLRQSGDQATLGGIAKTCSSALTRVAIWHAQWIGAKTEVEAVVVKLNTDFFGGAMDSGDLTALLQTWQGGGISYDTFYYNLERVHMTRPGIDAETERTLIEVQTPQVDLGLPPETPPPSSSTDTEKQKGQMRSGASA